MTSMHPDELHPHLLLTAEGRRLGAAEAEGWRRWGPYVSERQWGTVREDYSAGGDAWDYFPHEHARSRAYRWGEDGLAGFCDAAQNWCLGLGLWNGQDNILKERLFGLTNTEGNHGEDVKELYFYQDGTPTHSYMRMLYKYPQAAFPYEELVEENHRRDASAPEYELLDTGVFADGRYFDVTVEYAKAAPDDILMRITIDNRAGEAAPLHVLPQLWARNDWSWSPGNPRPRITLAGEAVRAVHPRLDALGLAIDQPATWLFCENETNGPKLFGAHGAGPFKDGINDCIVHGMHEAVRLDAGSKAAAHVALLLAPGGQAVVRLRLRPQAGSADDFADFDAVFATRQREADAFYAALQADIADPDARLVQRQALAGMLWSKQFYHLDMRRWQDGDPAQPPPPPDRLAGRNADWRHLYHADVVSMPDKWEYPWYASWDLAFHAVTFALIDPDFAKAQLLLLLRDCCLHPNGQLPAYEWAFGDANPPVHAWACWRVYQMDLALCGEADRSFLQVAFHKLLLNFSWWVNRKDADGRGVFQGGFLGLDNIEIFDRSAPLPTGGRIDQSDGTAWMAAYALNMMRIALELARTDHAYEPIAVSFFEHFLYIAEAMSLSGSSASGLWDEQDAFFYDVLHLPDGQDVPLRVRSIVGLIPLFAVHVLEPELMQELPYFAARVEWFLDNRPELAGLVSNWTLPGIGKRRLLSLLRGHRMKCLLARMLDEGEFLSDHGVRALSKVHAAHPFVLKHNGQSFGIDYEPGESTSGLFGGNSNWRGPVWLPINYMIIEKLYDFQRYYGDDFTVEYPSGSGQSASLREIAEMLARRLAGLSLRDARGQRPVMAAYPGLAAQPGGADLVLFHEYYHGESGRGVGASHQTGWSGLVALLLQPRREEAASNLPCAPAVCRSLPQESLAS
jgi:hypothetical protein